MAIIAPPPRHSKLDISELNETAAYHGLMSWNLTRIVEIVRARFGLDVEDAALSAHGYRQFLAMRLAGYVGLAAPELIAQFWETHILETPDYIGLCEVLGSYLHHTTVPSAVLNRYGARERLERVYAAVFGIPLTGQVWRGPLLCHALSRQEPIRFDSDGLTDQQTDGKTSRPA